MALLSLKDVSLAFGGPRLLDGVTVQVERNERVCLLGRNGEGKSTLMRLICGEIEPDEGEIVRAQGLRIARLEQDVPDHPSTSVAEEVAQGLGSGSDPDHRVDSLLTRMGLDGDLRFESLSAGMKRRVLLARALVAEPDVLLLDEPTNHLDIEAIGWLEDFLLRYGGTLLFVTHDRAFLNRLATRIIELDRGKIFDWACDYPTFLKRREELLAAEARHQALFDKKLAQEEVWIRKGIQARRPRNEGRVRALKALREARSQRRERQGVARMQAQEAEKSGSMVIKAEDVAFSYGERPVLRGLTTAITRGDKVGIIGPNGAGKSTLLRLLLGQLSPSSGGIRLGTNLEIAYFDQSKATLDDEKTVQQSVSDGYDTIVIDGQPRHVVGYLQDFLFPPERSRSLVRQLSGGERSRLLLAKLFTKPSNVLVLDEPTNDLDVETLELLENLLVGYQGTLLIVSHDRAFLNNVATSTLAIDASGEVKEYDGGYDDFLRQKQADMPIIVAHTKPIAAPKEKPKKMGNKERRELDALPRKIEELEASKQKLHDEMSDPAFYRKAGGEIAEVSAKVEALEQELLQTYERWELLEAMASS